jgi:transposase
VRDVIHTFNAKGLAALDPRWAGGRPRLISDGDIEVIVTAATNRAIAGTSVPDADAMMIIARRTICSSRRPS